MQNNGVMVMVESMHFSILKGKNQIMTSICYFGVIEKILKVDYTKFRVSIQINMSVQTNELGFTFVDLGKVGYKGESFIMVSHGKQVFYVNDLLNKRSMHRSDENLDTSFDLTDTPSFSTHMPTFNGGNEVYDVHVT
ncbi:hypothetical protein CR513_35031, partial [Mucuna pruriens]